MDRSGHRSCRTARSGRANVWNGSLSKPKQQRSRRVVPRPLEEQQNRTLAVGGSLFLFAARNVTQAGVRSAYVILDAVAFRSRHPLSRCCQRHKDIEAQRELRDLAKDLDDEADKIESEDSRTEPDQSAKR